MPRQPVALQGKAHCPGSPEAFIKLPSRPLTPAPLNLLTPLLPQEPAVARTPCPQQTFSVRPSEPDTHGAFTPMVTEKRCFRSSRVPSDRSLHQLSLGGVSSWAQSHGMAPSNLTSSCLYMHCGASDSCLKHSTQTLELGLCLAPALDSCQPTGSLIRRKHKLP